MELIFTLVVAGLYVLGTRQAEVIYDNEMVIRDHLISNETYEADEIRVPNRLLAVYGWPYFAARTLWAKAQELPLE